MTYPGFLFIKSILHNLLNNETSISKLFGKQTIFPNSSTSIRLETKAKLSFASLMISWLSSLSNLAEQFLNFSSNSSKSLLVIILAKIFADLLIILALSEKFSTTSHSIWGASASFTSFFPSSFLHILSTTISPLKTALLSILSQHFLTFIKILGTIPFFIKNSLPVFWLLTFFIVSKFILITIISSEYKSFTNLIVSANPAFNNLLISWGTWHKLFKHLIKGTDPGPLFFDNSISITASWPLFSTNFWANSWSTLRSYKDVSFTIISAICLQRSSLWTFFRAIWRRTSIPPPSMINFAFNLASLLGGVIILSKDVKE